MESIKISLETEAFSVTRYFAGVFETGNGEYEFTIIDNSNSQTIEWCYSPYPAESDKLGKLNDAILSLYRNQTYGFF